MIDTYRFGSIVIDGVAYSHDVIVSADRVVRWWRKEGHAVCEEDLASALEGNPDVIVIGTGMAGMMRVLPDLIEALRARGIEAVVERTGTAWKAFNAHRAKSEAVVGAFHLTC